ncbi:hypothetical protein HPP92_007752 [Vanilla planifolia]|uniref:Protein DETOXIFICATION n=1 Tax=Vanilla planifolia TaxID=51239 RepID=A0A835RKU3_VANPL|nr:hypothetical protein HPP92_007752 [Vanilla planifolia]
MGSLNDFLVSDSVAASRTQRMEWPFAFSSMMQGGKMNFPSIALPAALALLADPIASLVDTAFIGRIGPVELAAVGVSIAVFNQVSRVAIFPLVSITTSFVAEEDASSKIDDELIIGGVKHHSELNELVLHDDTIKGANNSSFTGVSTNSVNTKIERKHIPSVSTALVIGGILGILQAIFLVFTARPILNFMGVKNDSPMLTPARQYLTLRSLGAPAVLLSLAMQGVFRGFKDTKTPLYATGSLLLARVIAVTFCITLSASMAARLGSIPMAAFQICLQVWLTSSLLADGLAVAGQTILASAFAQRDFLKAVSAASRVLQWGFILGLFLCAVLGSSLQFVSRLFTNDAGVLHVINIGIPFVVLTQPINALAFVFDGVNFGASDFAYSAYSLVMVAIVSILCLVFLSSNYGFIEYGWR